MLYSKSTGGLYLPSAREKYERNGNWPSDLVEVPADRYAEIQNRPADKIVVPDENGLPAIADPVAPTDEQLAASVRAERDSRMAAFQWRLDRYNSEHRLGLRLTDDISVLDAYMQALRDVTKQATFPVSVVWPAVPA